MADENGEAQKTVLGKSQSVGNPAELTGHKKGSLAQGGIRDCAETTAQAPGRGWKGKIGLTEGLG